MNNSKRKVIFCLTDIYKTGGVQRVVSIIANSLVGEFEVEIFSLFASGSKVAFDLNPQIQVKHVFTSHFDLRKNFLRASKGIKKNLILKDGETVVVAGMGLVPVFWETLRTKKVKKIAWEHQCFSFGKKFGFEWLGKRIALKFWDNVVVLTKKDFEMYQEYRLSEKIVQIYNPFAMGNNVRKCDIFAKKIVSVGSLTNQKGFDYAIEIARQVFRAVDGWTWDIYGDGLEREKLQQMIINAGLQGKMQLMGHSDRVDTVYSSYSILSMTSRHEGFPMVLLEASSHSMPMISFDCKCGPSEIIEDGCNGFLIEQYDTNLFANKMIELIDNETLRLKFSNNKPKYSNEMEMNYILDKWRTIL